MLRKFKKYLPASLFGRTLLILVLPTIVAQAFAVYMFYERHWSGLSRHLALSLAGEVATIAEYIESATDIETEKSFLARSKNLFFFNPYLKPHDQVESHVKGLQKARFKYYNTRLEKTLNHPFKVFSDNDKRISTVIYYPNNVLIVDVPYKRLFSSSSYVFLIWMTGTSTLLMVIAVIFLRNQVRPIVRLSRLADNFGRGQKAPASFRPEGAKEVRQAGQAFIKMQDRIQRYIKQRTEMLAGISHDLRTPLTRIKLDLEMLREKNSTCDFSGIGDDIRELELMVNSYLEFVRNDEDEEAVETDIVPLVEELIKKYPDAGFEALNSPLKPRIRPLAITRAVKNLLDNASRYGTKTKVSLLKFENNYVLLIVDDNGSGIPNDKREAVFKPFYRIEDSRNKETGGVGLGLSIVRDIINHHGGTVHIEDSPLGGARVIVKLPI